MNKRLPYQQRSKMGAELVSSKIRRSVNDHYSSSSQLLLGCLTSEKGYSRTLEYTDVVDYSWLDGRAERPAARECKIFCAFTS